MQKLGKRFLSLVMVGAMILSCNMVAFAKENVADTSDVIVAAADEIETDAVAVSAETADGISTMSNFSIMWIYGVPKQLDNEAKFKSGLEAGIDLHWTPYIDISASNESYCVYVGIYEPNGTRVCGTTFNVSGGMKGSYKVSNVSLNSWTTYTCKLIFDRQVDVGSVNLRTD